MHEFRGPQIHVAVLEDHFPWSVIDHDARSYINLFGCSLSEHECSVLARLVRPPQMDARSLCHTVSPVPNVAPLTPCAPGGCAVGCSGYLALFLPDWLPHSAPPGDGGRMDATRLTSSNSASTHGCSGHATVPKATHDCAEREALRIVQMDDCNRFAG